MAGTDAGHAYNTFPMMGGYFIPEEYWAPFSEAWRNPFENPAAVQLHHRILALCTLTGVGWTVLSHRTSALPRAPGLLLRSLAAATALQVSALWCCCETLGWCVLSNGLWLSLRLGNGLLLSPAKCSEFVEQTLPIVRSSPLSNCNCTSLSFRSAVIADLR